MRWLKGVISFMDKSKVKKLDDKAYEDYIKEMAGGEEVENIPTQKKD